MKSLQAVSASRRTTVKTASPEQSALPFAFPRSQYNICQRLVQDQGKGFVRNFVAVPKFARIMADREAMNKLKGLLEARLQPRKLRRFQEHHLLNIVKKGFLSEDDLSEATIDRLQAPPGEEIPLLLIDSILEVFNPQAGGIESVLPASAQTPQARLKRLKRVVAMLLMEGLELDTKFPISKKRLAMHGREEDLEWLWDKVERQIRLVKNNVGIGGSQKMEMLVLQGCSGSGKTRLALEFLRAMEYTVEKYPYQGNMPKAGVGIFVNFGLGHRYVPEQDGLL
ncbi:hypothetical protein WJX75_009700 [Coccomyxa subellipsoidea]|uniref:Uncharacterized protein n=1 Tax=Coccomyxa subellipsoidea TaxID=248742 RepID=A0ABR2YEE4_9CHLO